MQAYICGNSALEYYRANRTPSDTYDNAPEHLRLDDAAYSISDLEFVCLTGLLLPDPSKDNPFHVLIPLKCHRGRSPRFHTTICGKALPEGSFVEGNADACISSPEFLFVQMARELSFVELVELGMELCGTYRLACASYDTRYDFAPLTTPDKMKDYIDRAVGLPGVKQARLALKHVLPNSASPMETVLYLLLCLPRRLGGYAFPQPILNKKVDITTSGKRFTLRNSSRPDLCWEKKKLDLEYQGSSHEELEARAEDSMRRKALEKSGYTVYELTYAEVKDENLFRANVRALAKKLGVRIRSRSEGDFAEHEKSLRDALLGKKATKLEGWEQGYWQEKYAEPQRSWREIAESYGITELPSEYASWEDYLKGYVPIEALDLRA